MEGFLEYLKKKEEEKRKTERGENVEPVEPVERYDKAIAAKYAIVEQVIYAIMEVLKDHKLPPLTSDEEKMYRDRMSRWLLGFICTVKPTEAKKEAEELAEIAEDLARAFPEVIK